MEKDQFLKVKGYQTTWNIIAKTTWCDTTMEDTCHYILFKPTEHKIPTVKANKYYRYLVVIMCQHRFDCNKRTILVWNSDTECYRTNEFPPNSYVKI